MSIFGYVVLLIVGGTVGLVLFCVVAASGRAEVASENNRLKAQRDSLLDAIKADRLRGDKAA